MFGIPSEVLVGLISSVGGFVMKFMAQRSADQTALIKLGMEQNKLRSSLADAAAKRSSPWLRKFVATTVTLVAFVGVFIVAFFDSIPVSVIQDIPQKSLLWGLIKWGRTTEVISANGFVMADWFRYSVVSITFFLFGTGAAKTK